MYKNDRPNWIKVLPDKKIYIFGGGKRGEYIYKKLKVIDGCKVWGIIDNNGEVIYKFNNGDGWVECGFSLDDYKNIKDENDLIIVSTAFNEIAAQLVNNNIYHYVNWYDIDFTSIGKIHYDSEYFEMQLEYAKIDSEIDKEFFQPYIKEKDHIAEFGSGGGLLLDKLKCEEKVGIEINRTAIAYAKNHGILSVLSLDEIKEESLDVVISTHALEHCLDPYGIVCKIQKTLKKGGRFICVVPYEPLSYEYEINNPSQHLFIWNQRTLGNLIKTAGFYIRETGIRDVAWPSGWERMFSEHTKDWFNAISTIESARIGYYSVYVVAEK